jgi:anti-sigma factor RsiW
MTPCDRYERDLLMMLHGELGLLPGIRVKSHLLTCPACRERLAAFRRLSNRLAIGLRRPNSVRPLGMFIPRAAFAVGRVKILLLTLLVVAGVWTYQVSAQAASGAGTFGGLTQSGTTAPACQIKGTKKMVIETFPRPKGAKP